MSEVYGSSYYAYLETDGVQLFTVVCLPPEGKKCPVVLFRSPYVDDMELRTEAEICAAYLAGNRNFLERGYAVVFQHCRGRGKSSGDCIPYIYEREDGLHLQEWVRKQPFYNGEIYLCGSSYTASVHFVTAPFAEDIKGAVLQVQDCERYNCNYRNGFFKMGLHAGWYVGMYKKKSNLQKNYTVESCNMLPLSEFTRTVLGENAADFDEILKHPDRNDPFWLTRYGGGEAKNAIRSANIPILLVSGFYDIYTGGVFDMWNGLDTDTRAKCALAVHPYEHGGTGVGQPVRFENGTLAEAFGDYVCRWLDAVRGKTEFPFPQGKVTYYKLFGDTWCSEDFSEGQERLRFPLGEGSVTYRYDPMNPATFRGGLSTNFGGNAWQDPPNSRPDMISLYTPEFWADTFVKGKLRGTLRVKSTCEDTCFYMRISLCKQEGDYGLRDDINQISNVCSDYCSGDAVEIPFSFDEHAFVIQKGEKLRIDISSSAFPLYVRHTNNAGLYSEQKTVKIADNTVILGESFIEIPLEI